MSIERRSLREYASKISPLGYAFLGYLYAQNALFAGSLGNEKQAKVSLALAATCFTLGSLDAFEKGRKE